MDNRALGLGILGHRPRRDLLSALVGLAERIDAYRRFVRAGAEIVQLLRLSDARLAARGLERAEVARNIFAKHGLDLGA